MTEKSNVKGPDPRKWHPILSAVIGAILGGGGSLGVVFSTPLGQELARPNPYTSVEAGIAQAKTDARLTVLEQHVGADHPDRRSNFDARITENTLQIGMMSIHLNNMFTAVEKNSDKLDKLLERK